MRYTTTAVDPEVSIHSLHAYFLRAGESGTPILYEVDRIRDGRSFSTRRVVAIQHGKAIFHMSASFQRPEDGFTHQFDSPVADTPSPDSLPDFHARYAHMKESLGDWYDRPRAIDMRYVDWEPEDRRSELPPRQRVWMRAAGTPWACTSAIACSVIVVLPEDSGPKISTIRP